MNYFGKTTRLCGFCGRPPQNKNKEHILPQWLLRITGNPNRVVNFGVNFETGEPLKFSWSSFVVPVCAECNNEFSDLENNARTLIHNLMNCESLPAKDYLLLLDWLDKVRIGTWIAYHYLQKNPTGIEPNFYIKSRIATKDRLLAIYPMPNQRDGLNIIGAESLLFHRQPSCFGLRINNLLILNMSSDYLISARSGFPFPKSMKLLLDTPEGASLEGSQFKFSGKARHPILLPRLKKPSVLLYQPILQTTLDAIYHLLPKKKELIKNYIECNASTLTLPVKGKLIREFSNRLETLQNLDDKVEFDSIAGSESAPYNHLAGQVYDFQRFIFDSYTPVSSIADRRAAFITSNKALKNENLIRKAALINIRN